jgi:DNA-binding CsgD family transcriptional regulator
METGSRPWPLTGRHLALEAGLDALSDGAAALFLVGGPGVGKTRLAHELLQRIEVDGTPTARVIATMSDQRAPLAAISHLLPPTSGVDVTTIFQSAREVLTADAGRLVLHVDDAQFLDPSSASLLGNLADAQSLQLVVTARTGDPLPDAFAALRASESVLTVTLDDLDAISVDSLLHRVLGAPLDGAAEAQLLEISGGNPLFLRELVTGAIEDGALREIAGVWRLDGTIPPNAALAERILDRVKVLPEAVRDALDVIAVAEPIGLDDLEARFGLEALEALEQRGLIRVDVDGRRNQVRLAHPVYGEAVRSTLGRIRLRRLARDQAERVSGYEARRRDDGIRVVRWQMDAGLSPDPTLALAAARVARHALDFETAADMARAALEAGEQGAAPLLGESLYEIGDFAGLEEVVVAALAANPPEADFVQLTRTRAIGLLWGAGDHELAIAMLAAAEAAVSDPRHQELLRFARALDIAWSGDPSAALELAEPLLASAHEAVVVQAALVVELVAATVGPTGRTLELVDRWLPVHLALPDLSETTHPGNHLVTKALALANAGRLSEAGELAEFGYEAAVSSHSKIGQMWFSLQLGQISLARGDAEAADRWFRQQIALCDVIGHTRPRLVGLCQHAIALAHLGEAAAARECLAAIDASPVPLLPLFAIERARAAAWVAAVSGDLTGARRALIAGAEAAEAAGITLLAALARLDALRLGDPAQAVPLRSAAVSVDSRIVDLAADWAEGLSDGGSLETVAGSLEALGYTMYAAEAWAQSTDVWRRAGDRRRAAAAERRADELARACRGSVTPALATVDSIVPLTAREREVALLTVQGLSAKEVAGRLFVSPRTVSNHLQNVYGKLGITRRADLADAFGRLGEGLIDGMSPSDGGLR